MANFQDSYNNKNNTNKQNSDRIYFGRFVRREGKYGEFFKAIIDGHEFYMSDDTKNSKDGTKAYRIMKCKTPVEQKQNRNQS